MTSARSSGEIVRHAWWRLDPRQIVGDRFRIFYQNGTRPWSAASFLVFCLLPILLGLALVAFLGVPPPSTISLIVASFGILAAVLVGLLPVIHGLVSQAKIERAYTLGEVRIGELELERLRSLRELYAVIAFSILVLVFGVAAATFLAAIYELAPLPEKSATRLAGWWEWSALASSFLVYSVASSTTLSFIDLASGVYTALESQADESEHMIRDQLARCRKAPDTGPLDEEKVNP